ncbi:hypothetical protein ACHAXA_001269 [Cyclostephanos tholiformis]|uniref:Uncharacterized protein n=1 Tax=Cyclostephanos tholiformis TaxID=382380 RepID=A0ABD3RVH4_9STRA
MPHPTALTMSYASRRSVETNDAAMMNPPPPPPKLSIDESVTSLPNMMSSLWRLVSLASRTMIRGESATVIYPNMSRKLSDKFYLTKLLAHLDACKDVCDNFGIDTILIPYVDNNDGRRGFTVKSYRNPNGNAVGTFHQHNDVAAAIGGGSDMIFAPDPFWDDDEVWDFGGADDDDDYYDVDGGGSTTRTSTAGAASAAAAASSSSAIVTLPHLPLPDDDASIISITESWVSRMMADLALCPFTQSSSRSGIPPGPVRYAVDRLAASPEDAYASYWHEVSRIQDSSESDISTTLHVLPNFCCAIGGIGSSGVESFEQWADTLTGTLGDGNSSLDDLGDMIQLIFFHPDWTFRDAGRDRIGEGGMAGNYARRSPWPMVNILRTRQVRVAQRGIPTGLVYQQNEKTLSRIGTENLDRMLRLRDWSDVEGMKVDRRDMEALRVANDLQVDGVVRAEDKSFVYDSTPAANRVDRGQIDGGDMVNVILQALEIRLGKREDYGRDIVSPLNGAQTSAAMMASDFLLEELERIAEEFPHDARAPVLDHVDDGGDGSSSGSRSRGGYAAAYGFDADDYDDVEVGALRFGSGRELEDAEMSALFGIGGIPMKPEEY